MDCSEETSGRSRIALRAMTSAFEDTQEFAPRTYFVSILVAITLEIWWRWVRSWAAQVASSCERVTVPRAGCCLSATSSTYPLR